MPRRGREEIQQENAQLRQRVQDAEAQLIHVAQAVRASRASHAFEHALAWAALTVMVLANALAFLWAR